MDAITTKAKSLRGVWSGSRTVLVASRQALDLRGLLVTGPQFNEVRRTAAGRTFIVLGDAGDGASDSDSHRYRVPHTTVMETSGWSIGTRFAVPTADVATWEIVSAPVTTRVQM